MDKDEIDLILYRGCTIRIESKAPGAAIAEMYQVTVGPNADHFQKPHVRKILKSMSALMGDYEGWSE